MAPVINRSSGAATALMPVIPASTSPSLISNHQSLVVRLEETHLRVQTMPLEDFANALAYRIFLRVCKSNYGGPRAGKRNPDEPRHVPHLEDLGKTRQQRAAVRLVQPVSHGFPHALFAPVCDLSHEEGSPLYIVDRIAMRNLGRQSGAGLLRFQLVLGSNRHDRPLSRELRAGAENLISADGCHESAEKRGGHIIAMPLLRACYFQQALFFQIEATKEIGRCCPGETRGCTAAKTLGDRDLILDPKRKVREIFSCQTRNLYQHTTDENGPVGWDQLRIPAAKLQARGIPLQLAHLQIEVKLERETDRIEGRSEIGRSGRHPNPRRPVRHLFEQGHSAGPLLSSPVHKYS